MRSEVRNMALTVFVGCVGSVMSTQAGSPGGQAFTYQGQLKQGGIPYSGSADMQFSLVEVIGQTPVGATVEVPDVDVVNGLFTVTLDFGGGVFDGEDLELEIAVRVPHDPTDTAPLTTLQPRQLITTTPYATTARSALTVPGIDGHSLDAPDGDPLDALVVDNDGNVGVNTLTPQARLHSVGDQQSGLFGETQIVGPTNEAGVRGLARGVDGNGVLGVANTGTDAWGVGGTSSHGIGVAGTSTFGTGVFGQSSVGFAAHFVGQAFIEGNVGIGTTAPQNALHVVGTGAAANLADGVHIGGDSAGNAHIEMVSDGGTPYIDFSNDNAADFDARIILRGDDSLVVDGANLGIGTSPATGEKLHVAGDARFDGPNGIGVRNPNNLSGIVRLSWLNDVARIRWGGTNPGGANGFDFQKIGDISLLRILDNGNIGIGTTAPGNKLEVVAASNGDGIRLTGSNTSGTKSPGYHLYDSTTQRGTLGLAESANAFSSDAEIGDVVLRTNTGKLLLQNGTGASAVTISGNNVGVGTAAPATLLDVNGTATVQDMTVKNQVVHPFSPGATPDPIHPIAYGHVSASGNIDSGTPNFTASWDAAGSRYLITIDGESYNFIGYVTIVTPVASTTVMASTFSSSGKLVVDLRDRTGAAVQSNFAFVVFKPAF